MPITVPKPITAPPPVQVSHSPYNTATAAWNANQQFGGAPVSQNLAPLPVGTILGTTQAQRIPTQTPQIASQKSPWVTPPKQSNVQQYLGNLISGWSLNPQTGQVASPSQMMGKAGGPSLASYMAHKGVLDPSSAQQALSQYQGLLATGKPLPNINQANWYKNLYNPQTIPPPQTAVPAGFWGGSNVAGQPMAVPAGWGQQSNVNQAASARAAQQAAVPAAMQVSSKGYRNY